MSIGTYTTSEIKSASFNALVGYSNFAQTYIGSDTNPSRLFATVLSDKIHVIPNNSSYSYILLDDIENYNSGNNTAFHVSGTPYVFPAVVTSTGTLVNGGLPNIWGKFGDFMTGATTNCTTGFTMTASSSVKNGGSTAKSSAYITFNAKEFNNLYGRYNAVLPNSLVTAFYIKY